LPPGYEKAESLSAQCTGLRGFRVIDDEALGNVDCNVARLSRALRSRAGELAADVIVGKRCRVRGGERFRIRCSAQAATAGGRVKSQAKSASGQPSLPAPSAEQVLDLDEPQPLESAEIRVSFAPRGSGGAPPPRSYDRVAELQYLPVSRAELGQVSARCEGCAELSLRHALRVTAGSVGATDVAAVRCFQDDASVRCVATAARPWSF